MIAIGDPSRPRGPRGAKPGANLLRPRPTQRDPLRAFAQVRARGPRIGFAQTRAYPPRLLRDEEAAQRRNLTNCECSYTAACNRRLRASPVMPVPWPRRNTDHFHSGDVAADSAALDRSQVG